MKLAILHGCRIWMERRHEPKCRPVASEGAGSTANEERGFAGERGAMYAASDMSRGMAG